MSATTITKAPPAGTAAGPQEGPAGVIIFALAFTGVIAAGMQSLIVPLLGQLPSLLGTTGAGAAWAVTVTPLVSAVAIPTAGRLGDMLGKKPLILVSLVPLVVGSIVCALATSLPAMIVGRGLQGLGMGIIPLGIALMREILPSQRLSSAVAAMSASMGVGGALALPFAAAIAQATTWRAMFWAFTGLSAIGIVLIWRLAPAGRQGDPSSRFDPLGAVLLAGGLLPLLIAISQGSTWGWASPMELACLVAAAVLLILWVWQEMRVAQPLINLRSLANRTCSLTNVASAFVAFAMYAQSLVLPQLFQLPAATGYGQGFSMLVMAFWYLPAGIAMMAVAPLGARLTRARGPKATLVVSSLIMAAGYAVAPVLIPHAWGLTLIAIIVNIGTGMGYGAIPILIMGSVPAGETAAANSLNSLLRNIGTSAGAAIIGLVLAQAGTTLGGHAVPSLPDFNIALAIGCVASLVAAAIAAALPKSR